MAKSRNYTKKEATFSVKSVMKNRILSSASSNGKKRLDTAKKFAIGNPMKTFFLVLGILLVIMVINLVVTPKVPEMVNKTPVREVSVYSIGKAPRINISAKVEKAGVVNIVAQTPGIVSSINVENGQSVSKGEVLLDLSNNYQGGNSLAVAQQLAADAYHNAKDTYDTQKDIIQKQRDLADAQRNNTDALRDIAKISNDDAQSLANLNAEVISNITNGITQLKDTNVNGSNDNAIQSAQQLEAQLRAGNNQLVSALRVSQYQVNSDNAPTKLETVTHDMTIEQLSIQEKALDLGLESSRLSFEMAQIAASMMEPAAPFEGVVSEVHVHEGQSVNPGTVLATLAGDDKNATIVAKLPLSISRNISKLEESTIYIGKNIYHALPQYVSDEATNGTLVTVIYSLPDVAYSKVADGQYVKIDVPIGYPDSTTSIPYVPIDSVYQTQDGAFVYLAKNGKVLGQKVTLGNVMGDAVEVSSGLHDGDQVILDRTVVNGDTIKITNSPYGKQQ